MTTPRYHAAARAAIALTGLVFLLYAALRPWHDETTLAGATAAMNSTGWVVSHLLAMIGFILLPLAPLVVYAATRGESEAVGPARVGIAATWIGTGLTLPYYGAETFGLHALGASAAAGNQPDLLALAEAIRMGPVATSTFALGLLSVAVGAVLTALAVRRSTVLPRRAAVPYAAAFVLFLPQFFAPAPIRVAHGVLVALGCVYLAIALHRATASRSDAETVGAVEVPRVE
jgi:hypothetical protein